MFWAVSGGTKTPLGPLFFRLFFHFFRFRFLFTFLSVLFLFPLFFLFSFFIPLFSFCFSFSRKDVSSFFHFVSLFSFLWCSKSVALQDSLVKSAHSELALFALYGLVVTFPCGIVHILVMIRLRVVYGGRRVGQVLSSSQNRQISAFDETANAPQSSLFSLLSSLFLSFSLFSLSRPVERSQKHELHMTQARKKLSRHLLMHSRQATMGLFHQPPSPSPSCSVPLSALLTFVCSS